MNKSINSCSSGYCFCRHNNVFKDVYREVGILEVFVQCLTKYASFLQEHVLPESGSHDIRLTDEGALVNGKKPHTHFYYYRKFFHFRFYSFISNKINNQTTVKYLANSCWKALVYC